MNERISHCFSIEAPKRLHPVFSFLNTSQLNEPGTHFLPCLPQHLSLSENIMNKQIIRHCSSIELPKWPPPPPFPQHLPLKQTRHTLSSLKLNERTDNNTLLKYRVPQMALSRPFPSLPSAPTTSTTRPPLPLLPLHRDLTSLHLLRAADV